MWKVKNSSINLPPDFSLREDEDFVYLFYEDVQVAVFSAGSVNPTEIKKEVEKYHRVLGSI